MSFNAQNARNSVRARAGTLPSRLQTGQMPEVHEQLGSLALLSPNTDQVPAELQGLGRLGRADHPASLRPFPSLLSSRSRGTSPFPVAAQAPATVNIAPTPAAVEVPLSPRPRKRSGSLNSIGSNTAFSPFAPNIWNSGTSGISSSPDGHNLHQPPYISTTPSRLRSRTFGGPTDASQPPNIGLYSVPRPHSYQTNPAGAVGGPVPRSRASTMSTSSHRHLSPSSGLALGRYVSQSIHDIPDDYVVTVDDLSPTPTLCLWINNVAPSATPFSLHAFFSQYGHVDAARVLPSCNSAFVKFADLQTAIEAQKHTNTVEIYPGQGPSLVGFVKDAEAPPISVPIAAQPSIPSISKGSLELTEVLTSLGASGAELQMSIETIDRARQYNQYEPETHPLPEQADRVYVSAVLREVRKRIDSENVPKDEIEDLAMAMMSELPVLASDYMGNTVVQQLFDNCSLEFRDMMLRGLKPYLAQTGVHKNGTWAAQKIIDVASSAREYHMITEAIKPFVVPLFLDQYGNYVIQCCLKFGSPWNDFIHEAIIVKMPEIAQGRFGARAIRACLESPHTSKQQQRLVAACIVENAAMLSTNANGSLLVSWLLDTYNSPTRFALVARRLLPVLSTVASSKLGSQVLLKIISNRVDTASARLILDSLLDLSSDSSTPILESLLQDSVNGPMFLFKLLNTGLAEYSLERQVAVNKIRMLLLKPDAVIPAHKRLLEEVGLSMLAPSEEARSFSPPHIATSDGGRDHKYAMGLQNYASGPAASAMQANNYQEWLRY